MKKMKKRKADKIRHWGNNDKKNGSGIGDNMKKKEKMKVKNMLLKRVKANLSRIKDQGNQFCLMKIFLKDWQLRVSPDRWKNKNLKNWQSEVSPDMWMKNGELAVKGKSRARQKDKNLFDWPFEL